MWHRRSLYSHPVNPKWGIGTHSYGHLVVHESQTQILKPLVDAQRGFKGMGD